MMWQFLALRIQCVVVWRSVALTRKCYTDHCCYQGSFHPYYVSVSLYVLRRFSGSWNAPLSRILRRFGSDSPAITCSVLDYVPHILRTVRSTCRVANPYNFKLTRPAVGSRTNLGRKSCVASRETIWKPAQPSHRANRKDESNELLTLVIDELIAAF